MRISRREFLQTSGALCIAFNLSEAKGASPASTLAPNAFVRIDSSGQVTVIVPYVEMGQGTYTSIPMLSSRAAVRSQLGRRARLRFLSVDRC